MGATLYDWSVNELFAPVWLDEETCCCTEGVPKPFGARYAVKLTRSTAFGTGGHPVTAGVYRQLRDIILSDDPCLQGRGKILEVDAGSGVLLLLAKKLRIDLEAYGVVPREEVQIFTANKKRNKILQLGVVPFAEFGSVASCIGHAGAFDLIMTQRGQQSWQVSYDKTLAFLHSCLAPGGKLIYGGFPYSELPLATHVFGEFFEVLRIEEDQGWPVLVGTPL